MLSHYKAVVWETGDDIILRAPGQVPADHGRRPALDIELSVRDYLNEGGKLLVTGKYALFAQAANGALLLQPVRRQPECTDARRPTRACRCSTTSCSTGSAPTTTSTAAAPTPTASPYPLAGIAGAFTGFAGTLNAAGSASNQDHTASFLTDVELPAAGRSSRSSPARRRWTGSARAPRRSTRTPATGTCTAGRPTSRYKRLTRTVDLTGGDAPAS